MMQFVYSFVFHYPLFMAFVLMTGGFCYHFFRERKSYSDDLPEEPLVSILVPCHNEEECIIQTIEYLEHQEYKNIEISQLASNLFILEARNNSLKSAGNIKIKDKEFCHGKI